MSNNVKHCLIISLQFLALALLVPPISLLAAWSYYQQGFVDLKVASLICAGFFLGGFVGAHFAVSLPDIVLKRLFGVAMLLVAIKMIISD